MRDSLFRSRVRYDTVHNSTPASGATGSVFFDADHTLYRRGVLDHGMLYSCWEYRKNTDIKKGHSGKNDFPGMPICTETCTFLLLLHGNALGFARLLFLKGDVESAIFILGIDLLFVNPFRQDKTS